MPRTIRSRLQPRPNSQTKANLPKNTFDRPVVKGRGGKTASGPWLGPFGPSELFNGSEQPMSLMFSDADGHVFSDLDGNPVESMMMDFAFFDLPAMSSTSNGPLTRLASSRQGNRAEVDMVHQKGPPKRHSWKASGLGHDHRARRRNHNLMQPSSRGFN